MIFLIYYCMSVKNKNEEKPNYSQDCETRRKTGFLLVWIVLLLIVWFIKSDKKTEYVFRIVIQKYLYLCQNDSEAPESGRHAAEHTVSYSDTEYCRYFAESYAVGQYAETMAKKLPQELSVQPETTGSIETMTAFSSYLNRAETSYEYLTSHFYVIDSTTSVSREELNADNLLNMDLSMDTSDSDYKILIYHTHGSEAFADSEQGNTEDTVIGVGNYLAELLEQQYGVHVYHDTTAYDMVNGELDRSAAYDYAREGVEQILAEHPSIEVVIDLHRDGVAEGTYLVTEMNGKRMAQIMFLNGVSRLNMNGDIDYLENPNKVENLAFSLQLYLTGKANYDSLMRKIFIRGYRYNLDFRGKSLLVEVGGQTNTVEEAKNAMEPFAAMLYKVLSGK